MQLLYVANRFERRADLDRWVAGGLIVICDRYLASSIAYGEAQYLDPVWLTDMQRHLPKPDLTVLLDISADTAARRKVQDRDRYEQDLKLLTRVRENYLRLANDERWVTIDGERSKAEVSEAVIVAATTRLSLP
jgi:dTMP kinase